MQKKLNHNNNKKNESTKNMVDISEEIRRKITSNKEGNTLSSSISFGKIKKK